MAKQELTCDDILKELRAKQYRPIYYLMGEESYYIDLIADYITDNVLSETEKEFNLTVVYGADVDVATIINAAKRYPMMSEHQVVVVKEAQAVRNMEELSYYLQKPLLSTILVICHKHGTLDRRKKLAAEVEKTGVLFESKKIKDAQLPGFIASYMKRKGVDMEPKATSMLADFVGSDLSRLTGELEKLIITLPAGQKRVTPEQIEKNIGISKDYNNFELRSALVEKDILKANKIIKYFEENPKTNPIQMTLSLLFSFYSNLMLTYYAPDKSEQGIANMLGLRTPWQARDYMAAMRKYSGVKTMQIVGEIRYADAKYVNVRLGDNDFKVLFDTGAGGFLLYSTEDYERLSDISKVTNHGYGIVAAGITGLGKPVDIKKVTVPPINIMGKEFTNVGSTTTVMNGSIIGVDLLEYGKVIIDYMRRRFYFFPFEEGKTDMGGAPALWNVSILPRNDRFEITTIWDSMKDKVAFGDQVININGTSLDDCPMSQMAVEDIMNAIPGDTGYIIVKKDNQEKKIEIRKEK